MPDDPAHPGPELSIGLPVVHEGDAVERMLRALSTGARTVDELAVDVGGTLREDTSL